MNTTFYVKYALWLKLALLFKFRLVVDFDSTQETHKSPIKALQSLFLQYEVQANPCIPFKMKFVHTFTIHGMIGSVACQCHYQRGSVYRVQLSLSLSCHDETSEALSRPTAILRLSCIIQLSLVLHCHTICCKALSLVALSNTSGLDSTNESDVESVTDDVSRDDMIRSMHLLRFKLFCFTNSLHNYIMTRVSFTSPLIF